MYFIAKFFPKFIFLERLNTMLPLSVVSTKHFRSKVSWISERMSAPVGPLSPRDNTRHGMRFAPGVLGAVHPVYRQVAVGSGQRPEKETERKDG